MKARETRQKKMVFVEKLVDALLVGKAFGSSWSSPVRERFLAWTFWFFSFSLSFLLFFFSVFFIHTIRQSATTRLNIWSDCVHNLGLLLSGSVCALQTIKICSFIIFHLPITLYLSVLVCVFDLFVFCFCRFFLFLF